MRLHEEMQSTCPSSPGPSPPLQGPITEIDQNGTRITQMETGVPIFHLHTWYREKGAMFSSSQQRVPYPGVTSVTLFQGFCCVAGPSPVCFYR